MSEADNLNKPISDPNPEIEDSTVPESQEEELTPVLEASEPPEPPSVSETSEAPESTQDSNLGLSELPELKLPQRPVPLSSELVTQGEQKTQEALQKSLRESDWFTLTRKLRRRNRDLLKKVANLEQTLGKTQEALQKQIQRSRNANHLSAQHAQELQAAQEQVNRLFGELETSHQAAQRQQILIETLSEQLETSQERVATLERQCTLLQEQCNEQAHKIVQVEHNYQELHARLQRQQRHTLQFKAALDKCLEIPDPKAETPPETAAMERQQLRNQFNSASSIPKAQPIQPWSAQFNALDELAETSPPWARKEFQDLSIEEESSREETTAISAQSLPAIPDLADMESLEEGDFTLSLEEIRAELAQTRQSLDEITSEVQEVMEQQEEQPFPAQDESETQPENTRPKPAPTNKTPESSPERQIPSMINSPASKNPQLTSPSPIIYPLRSRKKVKSLAAIDLPSFPRLVIPQ